MAHRCVWVQAFESGALNLGDFYFTGDDYRYRFEAEAKQRFINSIREQFNGGVAYRGRTLKWDTVIEQKANELGRFLVTKASAIDFAEPALRMERYDGGELRARIVAITSSEAEQLGIGKSTLHYLRKRAKTERKFRVYAKVSQKIDFLSC